ncbi:MAG: gliding motility-associated C-terminal domain-containing protein [Bacteroidetes bacterium]|nr:gliding motility-associated C-terminal domain-containing protein [Bacteroidota bacterium]
MNINSFSQINLIYNGDFELYDTCPDNTSAPGNYEIQYCKGWKSPTYATSDYFNACDNLPASGTVGVPQNTLGFQYAYSGVGYCGALWQNYKYGDGFWVEYIQSKLTEPLKQDYEYELKFQVVLSDLLNEYALWHLGAAFTQNAITRTDAKPFIGISPQIINQQYNFITDTLNWTEIGGKFFAKGGEEYITIGFFFDTLAYDTLRFTNFQIDPNNYATYYYIDGCSLIETGNIYQYPNIFTPNNDGINDLFFINGLEKGDIVKIFDRWGIPIAELNEPKSAWDGYTSAGIKCSSGVYYYIIEKTNGDIIKGFIHLQY